MPKVVAVPYSGHGSEITGIDRVWHHYNLASSRALRLPSGFWSLLGYSDLAHGPLYRLFGGDLRNSIVNVSDCSTLPSIEEAKYTNYRSSASGQLLLEVLQRL